MTDMPAQMVARERRRAPRFLSGIVARWNDGPGLARRMEFARRGPSRLVLSAALSSLPRLLALTSQDGANRVIALEPTPLALEGPVMRCAHSNALDYVFCRLRLRSGLLSHRVQPDRECGRPKANARDSVGSHDGNLEKRSSVRARQSRRSFPWSRTNDYVSIPDALDMRLLSQSAFSLDAWVTPSQYSSNAYMAVTLTKPTTTACFTLLN
jgi:hypothetical protein